MDASRQTTRVSANVSGILGTERITLNDNLLNRASPGRFWRSWAMKWGTTCSTHVYKMLLAFGVIIVVGFAIVAWAFDRLRRQACVPLGRPSGRAIPQAFRSSRCCFDLSSSC